MILSRSKPAESRDEQAMSRSRSTKKKELPKLEDFLQKRDYVGALTLLEFMDGSGKPIDAQDEWIAYCAFHLGDYRRALQTYKKLLASEGSSERIWLYLACCCFFLGMYEEADAAAQKGPQCALKNRLLFHLAHKFGDDKRLMTYHQQLQDIMEDKMSLASIHYMRSHYQEAIDTYKRIVLEDTNMVALNAYIALCYYKLDYYDVSQEIINVYLMSFPDSAIALNLKACNHFRLYNGKAAEQELMTLKEKASLSFEFAQDLIKHNLVVFRDGEGALQVWSKLLDVIPEARLNLVIFFLRQNDLDEAFKLVKDMEPSTPPEYILKGVVNACIGQEQDSSDHLKLAQQYFQLVGGSASECGQSAVVVVGGGVRWCCWCCCWCSCPCLCSSCPSCLRKLWHTKRESVCVCVKWHEAEETFLLVQSEAYKSDYTYLSWLARCYIMNKKPRLAWELYLRMETSADSYLLLQLIAHDCYRMGAFYYSAKAFDVLERLDPSPEYWEGKRGACVGVFQQIIAGHEPKEGLREILAMLRNSNNPQVDQISRVMRKWAKDKRIPVM
ncbi:TTC26 protein [Salpingoeca rosetta]|uniref:TTC26 protein n=1 Tax=Salpingoeca rosetta (strain ATCC 50818 / BSB-021) TaxID=946362 RepID=F2TWU6_SALR5|nr:TTC26 protein [Salpingoeca rosetta]EGD72542.1 TTC26 protein [Salpingoeca rosetta]|eukprot:XP_004999111.1 TTC26 protein [Salpingoeca rosetta]